MKISFNPKKFINNENVIEEYIRYLRLAGKQEQTIESEFYKLVRLFEFVKNKPANEITRRDIEDFYIEMQKKVNAKELKAETLNANMVKIKSFFEWLKPGNLFFDSIKPMDIKPDTSERDYITADDVKAIVSICEHSRDRALIMLLWNTGARISELLTTKVGDVDLENAEITVEGKTGRRDIPITTAMPDIRIWLNQYKAPDSAPLFPLKICNRGDGNLSRRGAYYIIKDLVQRAGLANNGKFSNPHAWRHGRLTELAGKGVSEMELRLFAGWSRRSDMPDVYINTRSKDMKCKIREVDTGQKIKQVKKPEVDPLANITCYSCQTENPFDAKYCYKCSAILDEKLAVQRTVRKNEEIANLVKAQVAEMESKLFEKYSNPQCEAEKWQLEHMIKMRTDPEYRKKYEESIVYSESKELKIEDPKKYKDPSYWDYYVEE